MRLRFTIRDLLWLTLVVALAVGWWVDHRRRYEFLSRYAITGDSKQAVIGDYSEGKFWRRVGDSWVRTDMLEQAAMELWRQQTRDNADSSIPKQ
jgi:hypothetical protein